MNYTSIALLCLSLSLPMSAFASGFAPAEEDTFVTPREGLLETQHEPEPVEALFASNSSRLLPAAISALDPLIARTRFARDALLTLNGYSDARGSKNHNLILSIKRVNAVRDYLIDNGVRPNNIRTAAYGETRAAINIQESEALVRDRRVVITVSHNRPPRQDNTPAEYALAGE